MMVGRDVQLVAHKDEKVPGDVVLDVKDMTVASKMHKNNAVKDVTFQVRSGEIVCIAGIDGNGQTELIYGLTGLEPLESGTISLAGEDITHEEPVCEPAEERQPAGSDLHHQDLVSAQQGAGGPAQEAGFHR